MLLPFGGWIWRRCTHALPPIPQFPGSTFPHIFAYFYTAFFICTIAMGAALLIGLVVCNITLKPLMARPRPYDFVLDHYGQNIQLLIATQHDFSFPSGHTLASFEAATALLLHHKKLGIAAMILAVIIAFTRLYLYVHYPTDVLFSVGLGVAFGFLGKWLVTKGYNAYDLRKAKH